MCLDRGGAADASAAGSDKGGFAAVVGRRRNGDMAAAVWGRETVGIQERKRNAARGGRLDGVAGAELSDGGAAGRSEGVGRHGAIGSVDPVIRAGHSSYTARSRIGRLHVLGGQ